MSHVFPNVKPKKRQYLFSHSDRQDDSISIIKTYTSQKKDGSYHPITYSTVTRSSNVFCYNYIVFIRSLVWRGRSVIFLYLSYRSQFPLLFLFIYYLFICLFRQVLMDTVWTEICM